MRTIANTRPQRTEPRTESGQFAIVYYGSWLGIRNGKIEMFDWTAQALRFADRNAASQFASENALQYGTFEIVEMTRRA